MNRLDTDDKDVLSLDFEAANFTVFVHAVQDCDCRGRLESERLVHNTVSILKLLDILRGESPVQEFDI